MQTHSVATIPAARVTVDSVTYLGWPLVAYPFWFCEATGFLGYSTLNMRNKLVWAYVKKVARPRRRL